MSCSKVVNNSVIDYRHASGYVPTGIYLPRWNTRAIYNYVPLHSADWIIKRLTISEGLCANELATARGPIRFSPFLGISWLSNKVPGPTTNETCSRSMRCTTWVAASHRAKTRLSLNKTKSANRPVLLHWWIVILNHWTMLLVMFFASWCIWLLDLDDVWCNQTNPIKAKFLNHYNNHPPNKHIQKHAKIVLCRVASQKNTVQVDPTMFTAFTSVATSALNSTLCTV